MTITIASKSTRVIDHPLNLAPWSMKRKKSLSDCGSSKQCKKPSSSSYVRSCPVEVNESCEDVILKKKKIVKGKGKMTDVPNKPCTRSISRKLMADAMPKCGGANREHSANLSSDEDSLLHSPVREEGEISGGNSDNLFRSDVHRKRWKSFVNRDFLDDRYVQNKALKFGGIDKLLSKLKLDKSVLEMHPYVP